MDKKQIINQINKTIPAIKENISLDYLVLFGSYAKGTNHKWSDIDLAVISNDSTIIGITANKLNTFKKIREINPMFEPHFFKTEIWDNPEKGSFIEYIKKYGEVIYSNGSK